MNLSGDYQVDPFEFRHAYFFIKVANHHSSGSTALPDRGWWIQRVFYTKRFDCFWKFMVLYSHTTWSRFSLIFSLGQWRTTKKITLNRSNSDPNVFCKTESSILTYGILVQHLDLVGGDSSSLQSREWASQWPNYLQSMPWEAHRLINHLGYCNVHPNRLWNHAQERSKWQPCFAYGVYTLAGRVRLL